MKLFVKEQLENIRRSAEASLKQAQSDDEWIYKDRFRSTTIDGFQHILDLVGTLKDEQDK